MTKSIFNTKHGLCDPFSRYYWLEFSAVVQLIVDLILQIPFLYRNKEEMKRKMTGASP